MSHGRAHRSTSGAVAGLAVIVLVGLGLVGFGLVGPAYAAKPADPPGQANAGAASAHEKAKDTSTKADAGKGPDHSGGTAGTSGDPSQPQPPSNADQNGSGANHSGAYDSTRDGSPSMNGNGGGQAKGKPCAGCVGKADNKNPKGQNPNGSDPNAGYECERNHGVGRSNPAHTGCNTATPPPECPSGTTGTPPNCHTVQPPEECPPGTTGTFPDCDRVVPAVCVDNAATPEDECGSVTPPGHRNPPGDITPGDNPPGKHHPSSKAGPAPSKGVLPNTGPPDGLLPAAFAGVALLAGGMALTRSRRSR